MLTEDGLLASALDDDACVTLAEGDVSSGGRLILSSCKDGSSAADGPRTLGRAPISICVRGSQAPGPSARLVGQVRRMTSHEIMDGQLCC